MPNVRISQLPTVAVLGATALLEIVQSGQSQKVDAQSIANLKVVTVDDIQDATAFGKSVMTAVAFNQFMTDGLGTEAGAVLINDGSTWTPLSPGTLGEVLQTQGAGLPPVWAPGAGVGTVVSVATGTGLTGGPITASGTIEIAANGVTYALLQQVSAGSRLLGNATGGAANVAELTITNALDMATSTRGSLLYRGASAWAGLSPGTSGHVLTSQGAGADPVWQAVAAGGTVTNIATGAGLTGGPITTTGTIQIDTNGVTYALFQQVAASSLVGNPTGALADAQGITLGATLAFSGSALQTVAMTGDVTTAADSFATTIAAGAVTTTKLADGAVSYAKFGNIASDSLVGRDTVGPGAPESITVTGGIEFSGSGSIRTGAFTGDVTKAAGGTALTIATSAVTYAKIQNVTASRLLGNPTGGAAAPSEISLGTTLTFSGSALQTAALTGDVTASANSFVTTIAAGAVSYTKVAGTALATASEYRSNTASKILNANAVWSAADLVALTDAATVAVDMSTGINFTLTLAGNRTLGQPQNPKVGQSGVIYVVQSGGGNTLGYHGDYKFAGGTPPVLSTAAGAVDRLTYFVRSSTHIDIDISKARS